MTEAEIRRKIKFYNSLVDNCNPSAPAEATAIILSIVTDILNTEIESKKEIANELFDELAIGNTNFGRNCQCLKRR